MIVIEPLQTRIKELEKALADMTKERDRYAADLAWETIDAEKYRWIREHPTIIDWDAFPWAKDYEHPDWALDSAADMLDCSIEAVLEQQKDFSAGEFDD